MTCYLVTNKKIEYKTIVKKKERKKEKANNLF